MRTLLPDLLENRPGFTIDGRARKRDLFMPGTYFVLRSRRTFADTMNYVAQLSISPVAIVKENGTVFVYTSGGSGCIWYLGEEINTEQQASIDIIVEALRTMGAVPASVNPLTDALPPA